jgi:hypothetical protein
VGGAASAGAQEQRAARVRMHQQRDERQALLDRAGGAAALLLPVVDLEA